MRKLLAALTLSFLLLAEETVDQKTNARIRQEAMEHSQIMHTLHMLTDRYGPRLTGSPNYEDAARWAVTQLSQWGLKNAHLEPWDFGHPGWLNERAAGYLVSPIRDTLTFEVLAWTPSTNGAVSASAVQVEVPQGPLAPVTETAAGPGRGGRGSGPPARLGPTKEELNAWLAANASKVKGKMILVGKAAVIPVDFNPPAKRRDEAELKAQFDPDNPNPGFGRGGRGPAAPADPIEYGSHTWHTNLDTYERIVPDDAMKAAAVIAAGVWHVANRDEMLPRFAKDQMPAPPPPPPAAR